MVAVIEDEATEAASSASRGLAKSEGLGLRSAINVGLASQQRSEDGGLIAPTQFSVAMPHLWRSPPQLRRLAHPVRNALHFVVTMDADLAALRQPPASPELPPLPPSMSQRMTLVLDLDETLVHCRPEPVHHIRHDFMVRFEEAKADGWIYLRPFCNLFLEIVAKLFDVVVFTASSACYANQVLDTLDPTGKLISTRLYRQHCTEYMGGYLKDMRRLGRPMEKVILVDNSPVSVAMNPDNGLVIASWTAEDPKTDRDLLDLLLVLQQAVLHGSATEFLSQRYGLRTFLDELRRQPELLEL